MKSIKPGRGPSFMGGIGSAVAVIFGIMWTVFAASLGAPAIFPVFGVVFVLAGIAQAVYNFKNATGSERFSAFDITNENEEPDPLNRRFGPAGQTGPGADPGPGQGASPVTGPGAGFQSVPLEGAGEKGNFCPYCGARVEEEYEFCRQCGKKL